MPAARNDDRAPLVAVGSAGPVRDGSAFVRRMPVRCLAIGLIFGLLALRVAIPLRVVGLACVAIVWTLIEAGNLRPIGFARRRLAPTLVWGIGLAVAVIVMGTIVQPMLERALGARPDYSVYRALAGNAAALVKLLGFALLSAAFAEEVLFRGFLLHQLTAILGSGRWARWASIVAGGAIFGVAHFIQGPVGIINTGIVGMIFGWAWFRTRRNLWALMLGHALIDTYGIGMLYLGWVG